MEVINKEIIKPGQRVLIRASLNVTLDEDNNIVDDLRLRRTIQTLEIVLHAGGIPILISHLSKANKVTLNKIIEWFDDKGYQANLVSNFFPYQSQLDNFKSGQVYIFENLRDYPGEEANDIEFATTLARYGDIYINESFDSAHRAHASIVGIPSLLPSYAGINFAKEVSELSKVFEPSRPFLFIIGGAKIETKAPLIRKLLDKADQVYVAGALMNPLLAARGFSVGKSLMPEVEIDVTDIVNHPNLVLPVDFVDQDRKILEPNETGDDSQLLGIGPASRQALELLIKESALVAWNGPLGNYEAGYVAGTDMVAKAMSESDTFTIIGGGDTLAAVNDEVEAKIDWVSTGGGAMLDFIESDGDLPAIRALRGL